MLNLITYLPLFQGIGPVILGVAGTLAPIAYWGAFFIVVFLAFSITLNAVATGYSPQTFSTIYWTMNSLFLGIFGQASPIDDIQQAGDPLGLVLYGIFLSFLFFSFFLLLL